MLTYAIGDIHGKLDMLVELLALIEKDAKGENYKLVFVGDYIDRGPNSRGVIDHLIKLQALRDQYGLETICLMGNHEDMAVNDQFKDSWVMNGGAATLMSYPDKVISAEHVAWIKALPMYHETDYNYFAHASVVPNIPLNEHTPVQLMWTRYRYEEQSGLDKVLIHGHTPVKRPEITIDRINIDTGAVFLDHGYGRLTAAKIPAGTGTPSDFLYVQEDFLSSRVNSLMGE